MTRLRRRLDDKPAWALWMDIPFTLIAPATSTPEGCRPTTFARHYLVECDGRRAAYTTTALQHEFAVERPSRAKTCDA